MGDDKAVGLAVGTELELALEGGLGVLQVLVAPGGVVVGGVVLGLVGGKAGAGHEAGLGEFALQRDERDHEAGAFLDAVEVDVGLLPAP